MLQLTSKKKRTNSIKRILHLTIRKNHNKSLQCFLIIYSNTYKQKTLDVDSETKKKFQQGIASNRKADPIY